MTSAAAAVLTITKQIRDLQKGNDLSLQAAYRNENVHVVRALIIGPPDTPYEFGFYEFNLKFPSTYPQQPPKVRAITTNYGRTRFNPNIYANGLVCLSTLGTWRGERGETWSPVLGIESVLVSIQSLMSANPFENEPGFEHHGQSHPGAVRYASKVHHENLRIAVVQRLEAILGISKESDLDLEKAKELRNPDKLTMNVDLGLEYMYSDSEDSSDGDNDGVSLNAPKVSTQKVSKQTAASKPKKISAPIAKPIKIPTSKDDYDGSPAKKQKINPYEPLAGTDAYKTDHEFDPFCDVTKLRFLWYFDVYMESAEDRVKQNASDMKSVEDRIKQNSKPKENIKPVSKTKTSSKSDLIESGSSSSLESVIISNQSEYYATKAAVKAQKGKATDTKPESAVIWEGMSFPLESFESHHNGMGGRYSYTQLQARLKVIRAALDKETDSWALQGVDAEKSQKLIAREMREDFDQIKLQNKNSVFSSSFDIELIDNNPFVWQMTLFGKFTTNLEGAIITVRICFSPNFPEEQPRVNVMTPLFHHRIANTGGVLCYVPANPDKVSSHVEAIIKAIEDDNAPYDPRTKVNPRAADLRWGGDDKHKIYNRKVRKSVQASLEAC